MGGLIVDGQLDLWLTLKWTPSFVCNSVTREGNLRLQKCVWTRKKRNKIIHDYSNISSLGTSEVASENRNPFIPFFQIKMACL